MRIEPRASWGHSARLGPPMPLPASELWIHHSAMTPSADFAQAMRDVERVGRQRFGRFSYSYAIHPSGRIGEGAGTTVGAHTKGRNSRALGVVFLGNFNNVAPTGAALDSGRWLILELQRTGRLRPGTYPTAAHRDNPASPSECPGDLLYPHVRGYLRQPWEDDDLTADESRMLRELHAVLIGNRQRAHPDDVGAANDLATPILDTNDKAGRTYRRVVEGG